MKIKPQNQNKANISIITRLRGEDYKSENEKNSYKYTIFSNNNNLYFSENPLDLTEINSLIKINKLSGLQNFTYNKVYSQFSPIDLIYQETLKNSINELFYNKNSCFFLFGPSFGGKSYLLRGSTIQKENESGLLTKAVDDIFQKIGLNNNNYRIRISVYQIYMDKIYDLLLTENDNNNMNIIGISNREIKNRNEFDLNLREAYKNILINETKGQSHLIISIYLENKKETKIISFNQIDFIELASYNQGYINKKNQVFNNINKTFNLIIENIINISKNNLINDDNDKLIISLKNTLKPGSNIIFFNCVIPYEYPLTNSYHASKFTSIIYNEINKNNKDMNKINKTYSLNYNINNENRMNYNTYHYNEKFLNNIDSLNNNDDNINININSDNKDNDNNNIELEKMNDYLNSLTINKMDYILKTNELINNKNTATTRENKRKIMLKMPLNNKKKIITNKKRKYNKEIYPKFNLTFDMKNPSPREEKLKEINKALKEIEKKNKELNKKSRQFDVNINNINDSDIYNSNNNDTEINKLNRTINSVETVEYAELKSDNIILKEDLERLNNINKNLEYYLNEERSRNIKIVNENEELSNRVIKLEKILEEMNYKEEKNKINELNMEKLLNEKMILTSRAEEQEKELNKLKEERENNKMEYKILLTEYNELKCNYDIILNEFDKVKIVHDEQLNSIENKVDTLMNEIDKLRNENNILRNENEKQRNGINEMSRENEEYKGQFNEIKKENEILNKKIKEMEKEYNEFRREKFNEDIIKARYEDNKRIKNENKMRIVNELHDKIQNYRKQRLNQDINN